MNVIYYYESSLKHLQIHVYKLTHSTRIFIRLSMLVRLNTDFPLFCISLVSGPVEVHVVMLRHTDNTGVTVTVFRRFTDCLVVGESSKRKKYRVFLLLHNTLQQTLVQGRDPRLYNRNCETSNKCVNLVEVDSQKEFL